MVKLTKRKGFNFFRSYFDVYNELTNNEDKIKFIDALLNKQFLGVEPEGLIGMAKFAYISQMNNINSQVKGYEDKTGIKLNTTPAIGGAQGGAVAPAVQEKEKEKEEVQEKEDYNQSLKHFVDWFNKEFDRNFKPIHKLESKYKNVL